MLYVSRAPWGIYEVLDEFFTQHDIPAGPVMFLREWGVSWTWPFPRKAEDHKRELIRHMLKLYDRLPFVLIGDSGQHDPEGYREIVDENPGRVLAVYIRNVSRGADRISEIEKLASAVAEAGSSLVLAADSVAMAEHAARLGLIPPDAISEVRAEADAAAAAGGTQARRKTRRVGRPTAKGAADAVVRGDLRDALNEGELLPNVEIGADTKGRAPERDG